MGRVQANLLMMRMDVKDFLITQSEKDRKEYEKYSERTHGFMEEAKKEIQNPKRAKLVAEADRLLDDYTDKFHEIESIQDEMDEQSAILIKAGPDLENMLAGIMKTAYEDGDADATYYSGAALRTLLRARMYASIFSESGDVAASEKAKSELANLKTQLKTMMRYEQNPDRHQSIVEAVTLSETYMEMFAKNIESATARNRVVSDNLDKWGPIIAGNLEEAKLSVKKDQDILGPKVQAQTAQSKVTIGILSIVAVVFGVLAWLLISRAITRPLGIATAFARDVSAGRFDADIDIDQQDEVGRICAALNNIKDSVSSAANEVEGIVSRVEHGEMKANGDADSFEGGFANLVKGVNALVAVYGRFLDQLPVGMMSLSSKFEPIYLNSTAKNVIGTESVSGKKCYDLLNTKDCRTAACASEICMKNRAAASSETISSLATGEYDISYTSIPLITRSGEVVGATEIIIDQTEIKQAQATMLNVAGQANEIADRVASASEELSAQIEEVSNGAEIQQERVGETATAMEQMNSSVLEIARNASEAREQSENARGRALEGAELVNNVVSAINKVNTVASTLQADMEKLGDQAKAIGGVMTVITDIADQTNLLALNAAIEAARAGEAGRGFAVVADEVRKLAEKTMDATNEVGSNIQSIQTATDTNLHNVNSAVQSVTEATELANSSGQALSQIVSMSTDSSDLVGGIATAAEEQSATSEQINRAVEEVNRIVSDSAEGMVQSAAAVQDLAEMALELREVLSRLRKD
jgi:methyl-accepting chemotaxis protein